MVKNFGDYLEELTLEYLRVIRGFEILQRDYVFQFSKKIKSRNRVFYTVYPSDVDIVGIKDNEMWVIECKEGVGKNDKNIFKRKFERAINKLRLAKQFQVKRGIACCEIHKDFPVDDFDEIFLFKEMILEIHEKECKKEKGWLTVGRFEWLLKWMNYTNLLAPSSKMILSGQIQRRIYKQSKTLRYERIK